ncbi:glycosyl hydrolase 2 galactose-binding domain-containing protein [Sabulibacter ruber]|uniref:glycosyl hydrolase 2 galactose-binding domain-containing protein n=1 Tax=Sabulibacter ruber TaxID=2811901 RepID=UPI001A956A58|nr:glycoside hydrolase family 2 TIM barrel-domain containing protein [Sabulibacter ruber]
MAQTSKLNYGLSKPQDQSTLPKAKAVPTKVQRKSKTTPYTQLLPLTDGAFEIANGWEMYEASKVGSSGSAISKPAHNSAAWYNATVPGTVLTTLVEQGIYPDPYFGLNNLVIPDTLCRQDWWYRTSFRIPEAQKNKTVWLTLHGVNYRAEIWLNGKAVGTMRGAFKRGTYNITNNLVAGGENVLAVHILPPLHPGIPHEESSLTGQGPNGGILALDGPTFISSEGWDWVPGIRDRNIGLWQKVTLTFTGDVVLQDPQVITDLPLPDTSQAQLTLITKVWNSGKKPKTVTVTVQLENTEVSQKVALKAGEIKTVSFAPAQFKELTMKNPRLWWPNGYGNPELYQMRLSITENGNQLSDERHIRFGVRELTYEMSVDFPQEQARRIEYAPTNLRAQRKLLFDNLNRREVQPEVHVPKLREGVNPDLFPHLPEKGTAPYLVLRVNGRRIFCRGGNWGMDDAMKRVSRERLEPYFKLHRNAHFNMIRNWTGESTEEVFYDLADEYGLLVWNDFWLSTEGYNLEPQDNELFLENAADVVKRFRNHPSIALWCPRNEGYAPVSLEDALATLIMNEDGTRLYQPNSRYLNLRPSGPWHYFKDPADYFRNNAQGFNTEIGTFSVPEAKTLRKFIPQEDLWPISDTWYYHDFHAEHQQKQYIGAVDSLYGKPRSVEEFTRKVQFINYDSHRAIFEAWNSKLWHNTSGVLLWMSHPAWPSMIWQTYTWDYGTHGSYYGSQKACEPVHVQMNLHDNQVAVVNTTMRSFPQATVTLEVYDLAGKRAQQLERPVMVAANQLTPVFTPDLPEGLPEVYLIRLTLKGNAGELLSQNEYWKTNPKNGDFKAFNQLPQVQLQGRLLKQDNQKHTILYEVINSTTIPALSLKFGLKTAENKEVLPAYFSDGYFTLLPGEKKQIQVTYPELVKHEKLSLTAEGYNVLQELE